jgi:hypothetical protein
MLRMHAFADARPDPSIEAQTLSLMQPPAHIQHLRYPVLLWRSGYSYVANDAIELCAHPRSMFSETAARGVAGEFKLADSDGALYAVAGFEVISRFGGLRTLGHAVLRSVFAVPVLTAATPEEVLMFKHVIARALRARFGKLFASRVEQAESPAEVLRLVADRDKLAG